MTRGRLIWTILLAALSGPALAALILLVPLGILTGVSAALDPSLAMYEFAPAEALFVPFVLLAGLISAANVRVALVMSRDRNPGRVFEATTDRYADDASGAENLHGHPGRQFALEFIEFLAKREGDLVSIGDPVGEDYGWGFWIGEKNFSPIWVAVAHSGRPDPDERAEEYVVAVTLEPPLSPWRRLTYRPDFALRDEIERALVEFLHAKGIAVVAEAEDWVDPEPKSRPAPRF